MSKSTKLTVWHQWFTLIGAPLIIGLLGWVAYQFDDMRFAVHDLQKSMGYVQQNLGRHTTELQEIKNRLGIHDARDN